MIAPRRSPVSAATSERSSNTLELVRMEAPERGASARMLGRWLKRVSRACLDTRHACLTAIENVTDNVYDSGHPVSVLSSQATGGLNRAHCSPVSGRLLTCHRGSSPRESK